MDRMIKDLSSLQTSSGNFDFRAEKKTLSNREFYSLSFWSASHLAFGENESAGRPAAISYYVQEDEGGGSFSLWRSDLSGAKPSPGKNQSGGFVICQNVDSWNLRFYDSTGAELDSWDSSSLAEQNGKAPVSVKISSGPGHHVERVAISHLPQRTQKTGIAAAAKWWRQPPYVRLRELGGEHPPWRAQPALWEGLRCMVAIGTYDHGDEWDKAKHEASSPCARAAALVAAIEVILVRCDLDTWSL